MTAAARTMAVAAIAPTKICSISSESLGVVDWSTNGARTESRSVGAAVRRLIKPQVCAMAISERSTASDAVSRGPKRNAAHNRAGITR